MSLLLHMSSAKARCELQELSETIEKVGSWKMVKFKQYCRKQIAELRPYVEGEDVTCVSISVVDRDAGSPKIGDMIARNPANHADQWLVAQKYFEDNFEPV